MRESYHFIRSALPHTKAALARGEITIGFIGGSITEPAGGMRWSDKIVDWFQMTYPSLIINVENAAKGATGSLSAVFRVEQDIISRNCDLVLIETAVNDADIACRARCREGLIRKLLRKGTFDIMLVYTYCQGMYDAMLQGDLPEGIAEYEQLARHYGITSVFCGQYAFDLVRHGGMRWEEWLPDGLHPEFAGSRVYAQAVATCLQEALLQPDAPHCIPEPLSRKNWENSYLFPLEQVERCGPWRLVRERRLPTVERILYTSSPCAALRLNFEGAGILIRMRVSGLSADYRFRIDNGEWVDRNDPRPAWGADATDWIREDLLAEGLPDGNHIFALETHFASGARASNFELCAIGIIR